VTFALPRGDELRDFERLADAVGCVLVTPIQVGTCINVTRTSEKCAVVEGHLVNTQPGKVKLLELGTAEVDQPTPSALEPRRPMGAAR